MKKVAETLANILENEVVSVALDRSQPIDKVVEEVKKSWSADIWERNPAPAYKEVIEGVQFYKGTDFDLFTAINALAERGAVINIPDYEGIAPKTVREDQRVISSRNRHGQVMGIVANKNTHSFSIKIKDYNVIQTNPDGTETVGAPRNFALVDYSGELHPGWKRIEVRSTPEEDCFYKSKDLEMGNTVIFENFVHPNLAFAFYGSRYIATKALAERIEDEAKHYRKVASELREEGITLGGRYKPKPRSFTEEWNTEKIDVENLEAKLVLPEFEGEYPLLGMNEKGKITEYRKMPYSAKGKQNVLRYSEKRAKELSYKIGPQITASVRAVELAFYKNGFESGIRAPGYEKQPGWNIPEWERGYKIGNGRTEWNALDLGDVVLAYRIHEKTVKKAA